MKIGILICTYNRPDYLRQCLESFKRADDTEHEVVYQIIDDHSTDKDTIQQIHHSGFHVAVNNTNRSIKYSMLVGCEILFTQRRCDVVMNFDGDSMVRNDFIKVLMALKRRHPANIITGFNCLTKNKNGSERHIVIGKGIGYNMKKSVGGINMVFDINQYQNYIKPALEKCLESGGNWDHLSCINSMEDGLGIICSEPSVVQHLGVGVSSMGHNVGGEPPDVADDFKPLHLPDVTLVGIDCVGYERIKKAMDISCSGVIFGDVKILTSINVPGDNRVYPIPVVHTKTAYSEFVMKRLNQYILTKHLLIVQYDGFILNPLAWRKEWLKYDYIGAPWMWYADHKKVGNGGFSLRTRRLHDILANDDAIVPMNDHIIKFKEEDHNICRLYRSYLEVSHKIKFAPVEEAAKFSIEGWGSPDKTWNGQFGFHGKHADISKSGYKI